MSLGLISTQGNPASSAYGFGGFLDLRPLEQVDAGQRHQDRCETRSNQRPTGCPSESDDDQREPDSAEKQ